ncbi:guanylate-binding protein 1-like [Monodelphis domestica]|uniref:guanylate-binding protein 1-like n=1 Tax=Monodelphis domestica TaxID=13616 RepID=UPI0024E243CD|nr:guanylate-binding protein 1-like [Monodelphis domestica]
MERQKAGAEQTPENASPKKWELKQTPLNMGSDVRMLAPECLIENNNGRLTVNQKSLKILASITEPMVVVAIVGNYRTGKSYLMNKLAGKKSGFSLGSTVQSHTKGIWMWCVPHPKKPNHTLVLLDTEGLGDVEKGNNKNDTWIFALAVLLSSTFVYNSMGTINQQAMDQLHYVTELTDRIKSKSSSKVNSVENISEFVSFFPDFVWTLRDFSLELEIDGKPVTPDEYLENALKPKKGKPEEVKMFNLPRQCIRQFFPKKKCFIFDRPAHRKMLSQLEKLHDSELDPDFVKQVESFCLYIFQDANVKTLQGGIQVNGPRLENLVLTYVEAITSGDMPCMENAVLALAQIENSAAVQKALTYYEKMMRQRVQFPTETLRELLDVHSTCEKEAIEIFIKDSFKDVDQKFQKELAGQLEAKRDAFCNQNLNESAQRCKAFVQEVFCPLEEAVKRGDFSKPGGYRLFVQKIKELKQNYYQKPRKGIQAEEILQEYLKSKEDVSEAILQADQSLSTKEKDIEVARVKAEAAEAAAKQLEEMQKKNEEMMEQRERSYQEHIKQVTEKMEAERKLLLEEQKNAMALKLKEQENLLKEGYKNESKELQKQIDSLKTQLNNNSKGSACVII